jgi:hypothetical protein
VYKGTNTGRKENKALSRKSLFVDSGEKDAASKQTGASGGG